MECVILAGGLATRMRPTTEKIPKSLIDVRDRPFLDYQLGCLARGGITRVVLCIGYKGERIREFAGDGSRWGLAIDYVDEGAELRGTGGALALALQSGALETEFFVIYGDSYLPVDYQAIWKSFLSRPEPALMTVMRNEGKWDQSNACYSQGKVTLYDKTLHPKPSDMLYIDYGLTALRRTAVQEAFPHPLRSGEKRDLAEILSGLSKRGLLAGYEIRERFYEIGSPAGLRDFENYVSAAGPD